MDDVLRHVVIAIGDEDLLAGYQIAFAVGHRPAAQRADVGTRLGLGQIHRAGPLAGDQLRQVCLALGRAAMGGDGLHRTLCQQRAKREGEIGRAPHLLQRDGQRPGQALAAIGGIEGKRIPAAGRELPVRRGEAFWRLDDAVLQPAAFPVAHDVERGQRFTSEFAALLKDGLGDIGGEIGNSRQAGKAGQIGEFLQAESNIGERRAIGCHAPMLKERGVAIHRQHRRSRFSQATSTGNSASICTGSRRSLFR